MAEVYLASNSYKERPQPERRVEGPVVRATRRDSPVAKIRNSIFVETGKDLADYVIFDIVIPGIKDAVANTVQRMLFGGSGYAVPTKNHTNYSTYARVRNSEYRDAPPALSRSSRATHRFDDIIFDERAEADLVLERLQDLIDTYGSATVADFYDLVGCSDDYTDRNWGWTSLRGAGIRRLRQGYSLDLPRTERL